MKLRLPTEFTVIWHDVCGITHYRTVTQDMLASETERLDREVELNHCTGYTITAVGRLEL